MVLSVVRLNRQTSALIDRKANLCAQEHTIQKSDAPERMRIEVEKTILAYEIGQSTGLFRVPRVLDYDERHGVAVFERLEHLESVRRRLTFASDYCELAERMGRSLAAIHDRLELPEPMSIPLPSELQCDGNTVFLHGDFSFNNVCIDGESDEIVILDWQMTKIHGGESTYGTRYFDMAWFLSNLFNRRLYHCPFGNSTAEIATLFLRSYMQASCAELDIWDYRKYLEQFVTDMTRRRRKQWSFSRKVMLAASPYFWQRYMTRLGSADCI